MSRVQARGEEMIRRHGFLGVPLETFDQGGRRQLIALLNEGLLDAFVRDSTPTSVFLTSYLPAQSSEDDYRGDAWVGTSHESNVAGVIRHSLAWIVEQCRKRGLKLTEPSGEAFDSQLWLVIRHG